MSRHCESPCAIAAAVLAKARWEARDLLSRRSRESAIELLFAHAAELALSPNAPDQLLGVALSAAAQSVAEGRAVLASPPTVFVDYDGKLHATRRAIRNKVFHYATDHWQAALEQAALFTQASQAQENPKNGFADSTKGLTEAAIELQRHLWDHPQIRADAHIRLVMFLSLPMLETQLRFASGVNNSKHLPVVRRRPMASLLKNLVRNLGRRRDPIRRLSTN